MRKSLIVVFLLSLSIHSQNDLGKSDDAARIVLNTFVPDDILENAPSARKLFVTKLGQIASRNGMGGGGASGNNRFIISGDINILTKDITATAPTKYIVTIETTLAVGDWMLVLQGPVLGTIRAVCISASSVFSEYAAGGSSGVDIMPAEFESPVLKIWSEATAMHLGYQLWSRRRENCAHIAKGLALTSLFATLA